MALQSQPKVAILLATYNGLKYLPEQIQSLMLQKSVDIHLFISDDYSTDGTWDYLNELKNNRITVLPRSKNYKSASGNFFYLLKEVNFDLFDYVSLSDQDDVWKTDKLRSCIDYIKLTNADACSSDVIAFWGESISHSKQKYILKSQPIGLWNHIFESAGPGCTFLLNKKTALEVKIFLHKNCENLQLIAFHDWLIFSFVVSRGLKWVILPKATLYYRQHSSNVIGVNSGLRSYLQRFKLLRNGWYLTQVFKISQLCKTEDSAPLVKLKNMSFKNLIFLFQKITSLRRKNTDRMILIFYFIYFYFRNKLN